MIYELPIIFVYMCGIAVFAIRKTLQLVQLFDTN